MANTYLDGKNLVISMSQTIGADGVPAEATKILGAKDGNISISANVIDVTTKDSGEWTESLPTTKSWSVDTSGLFILDDQIVIAQLVGKTLKLSIDIDGAKMTGNVIFNDYKTSSSSGDAMTYSITFTGTGEPTFTAKTKPEVPEEK